MSTRISVRLTPRAGSDSIDGWSLDASGARTLRVRVRPAPADGAANDALVQLLASQLRVPLRAVRILSGAKARTKLVEVTGVGPAALAALA